MKISERNQLDVFKTSLLGSAVLKNQKQKLLGAPPIT